MQVLLASGRNPVAARRARSLAEFTALPGRHA